MKRLIVIAAALLATATAFAQYEPTTTWPYIYPDFTSGTLKMNGGSDKEGLYNIDLANNTLHFIDGELIKEASKLEVFSVQIGEDVFVNAGGRMMKLLAKNDNGYVAQGTEVDVVKLNSTGAAYGSSSSSVGTASYSSLDGIGGNRTNMNHMEIKSNKDSGQTLPIIKKLYIVTGGKVIYATKKDVSEAVDADALKAFLKENKVKWTDPQSLMPVIDFIANQK